MASCSICGSSTITVTLVRQSSSGSVPSCMDQVTCDAELCCWSIQWLLTCDVVLCCWSVQSQFSGVVENCLTIYKLSIYLLYGHINVMLWWLASCSMFISIGKMFYFNLFTYLIIKYYEYMYIEWIAEWFIKWMIAWIDEWMKLYTQLQNCLIDAMATNTNINDIFNC